MAGTDLRDGVVPTDNNCKSGNNENCKIIAFIGYLLIHQRD